MSKWISVEERLPESDEVEIAWWDGTLMCRAFGAYGVVETGKIVGMGWMSYGEPLFGDDDPPEWRVTHWRECDPLPEPPERVE